MSKYQYRISTDSNNTSNYGFAYIVLVNPSGSGRKLTLRSLEVNVESGVVTTAGSSAILYKSSTVIGGEDMTMTATELDSSFTIPSTIKVRRNSIISTYTNIIRKVETLRQGGAAGNQNRLLLGSQMNIGARKKGFIGAYRSAMGPSYNIIEPITINNNESVALVSNPETNNSSNPVRVNICINIDGKSVVYDFVSIVRPGVALFSIENTSGGSSIVKLLNFDIMDIGTSDTPTLRIVPVGQLYASDVTDTSKQPTQFYTKMDSSYPSPPSGMKLYTDIGFIPYGVPEVAIASGSAATPRGLNYLHTRDFIGPMYRNMLVEMAQFKGAGTSLPDTLNFNLGHKRSDLLARRAGITINPGEGIAIVNSAETAVGVQTAWGGWPSLSFGMHVDDDVLIIPSLTLTGLIPGSDIVINNSNTNTALANIDQNSTSSYSYIFDYVAGTYVDIKIMKAGYLPYQIYGYLLINSDSTTIPISQVVDRNYI